MASDSDESNKTIQNITDENDEWFIDILGAFGEDDLENNYDMGVCIFQVPDVVLNVKPEAYRPQLIALGLYHHFQPELYQMEHYKLAAVKRAIKPKFDLLKFAKLVQGIVGEAQAILKCYSAQGILKRHTSSTALSDNKIAWIMAIDALFLLDLLNTSISQKPEGYYAIHRDVLKLENQIPLLVLKVIHEKLLNGPGPYHKPLCDMLLEFCCEISPIQLDQKATTTPPPNPDKVLDYRHLLGFLYHCVTYTKDDRETDGLARLPEEQYPCSRSKEYSNPECQPQPNKCPAVFSDIFNRLSSMPFGNSMSKVFTVISKMLPQVPIPSMAFFKKKKVLIPSVSKLYSAGVKFCRADGGGTKNVEFDEEMKTLKLPVITLKRTTDVVMRNLVAYETMARSERRSSNFKRFTELMSAIVDTIEDVHILKEAKILIVQKKDAQVPNNDQKDQDIVSDAEIVEIFNGMTKTMESKDRVIDEAIGKVNECYNNTRKVKAYRLMKKHVYSSWKMLTLLASLLFLSLTALQTFCGVYSCSKLFRTNLFKQT